MAEETLTELDDPLDVRSYVAENRHFVECIAHDRSADTTGEDGLRTLVISHAILRAYAEKRAVMC